MAKGVTREMERRTRFTGDTTRKRRIMNRVLRIMKKTMRYL